MQGLVSKTAALGYVSLACALLATGSGCGDDDAGPTRDAGMDGGDSDDGGFIRPRRDGQVGEDPVPECDRFDPLACGAGQRCQVVIRRGPGEEQFLIYSGCVEDTEPPRGLGDPCAPWGGLTLPYQAPGLEDELYVDPCDEGLFCAPDPQVRDSNSCQRACESGISGQRAALCSGANEFCSTLGVLQEFCRPADQCDPADPAACGPGRGCYLHMNDTGSNVITVCAPTAQMQVADGQPCRSINQCAPGSACWGPARVPPARWTAADLLCRPVCNTGAEPGADAGFEDEDGGVSGGGGACGSGRECVGFAGSGLDLSAVSPDLGQCE